MAQGFSTDAGSVIIPGTVVQQKVKQSVSGLATSGVLLLVGEADRGPRFSQEVDLNDNAFGPDQEAAVIAKYGSGPLVDGFRKAVNASNDPAIVGAPSRILLAKTNLGSKALVELETYAGGTYGYLADLGYGEDGNLISVEVEAATAEVAPTTGSVTFIPPVASVGLELRSNGGTARTATVTAAMSPATLVSTLNALTDIVATGGAAVATAQNSVGTLALDATASSLVITLTYSGTFTATPVVGSTLVIPAGSIVAGSADENVGAYVVTAATSSVLTATKVTDAGKSGAVAGTVTNPADDSGSVSSTVANDLVVYAPVVVTVDSSNPSPGLGKSLEIARTSGTESLFYGLGTATATTWLSVSGSAKLITSAAEYRALMTVGRELDSVEEEIEAGGEVALRVSYLGTTASMTISDTTLTTTVVGGTGANLSLNLSKFPTIADLARYIGAQTGYSASVGTAALGQQPSTALDDGTYGICSTFGALNGRVKIDGYRFFNKVSSDSVLVQLQDSDDEVVQAPAGLPGPLSLVFLAGGAKGSTTDADVLAALNAAKLTNVDMVVSLFSRDASDDVADGLTESASSYTIDAINLNVRTHVLAMNKLKAGKFRLGFVSQQADFETVKESASNMASPLMIFSFLDQKVVNSAGSVVQGQPWIDSCIAAGMLAAGQYRGIVRKFKDVSGSLQAEGDWSDLDDTNVEDALTSGLLPTRRHELGGYYFVSDQTTYTKDSNPIYNSAQAMYVANLIAKDLKRSVDDTFIGQSIADVPREVVKSFLVAKFDRYKAGKLIAASDEAPAGWKNLNVSISNGAVIVDVQLFLAGILYFASISTLLSTPTQTR